MEIIALLKNDEGKTFELKRDISSPAGIIKSIIAFANTAGGVLLIGVDDKTKHVRGVVEPLALEEKLASLLYDNIEPKVIPDIEVLPWRDTYILKIQVYPSANKPHYYKKQGLENGTFIRVGSTNRKADKAGIEDLRRYQRLKSYDEEPITELSSEAVDFSIASECFSELRKLKKSDLESLGLVTKYQNKLVPTIGGMILFGQDRSTYFPDAQIQVGRFQGNDKSTILDTRTIASYPVLAVEEAMSFVKKYAYQRIEIQSMRHKKQWNVPLNAVREAMINAVVHADYAKQGSFIRLAFFDDRIEIDNPGLLLFGLTIDDLMEGVSKLRNRVIARVFHQLGLIEQWGSGIRRIITECQKAGLAMPKFEELATHFRVTIYLHQRMEPQLDNVEKKLIKYLDKMATQGASTADIAKIIALSPRATRTRLKKLVDAGLIMEMASSEQDPNRRYYLK
ncbi:MAG: hypothetical protein Tsb005_20180 [Gammaproteobacteria bacterium]